MSNTIRCDWANRSEIEKNYHDSEWGRPLHDEIRLFEKVVLESMQAGLSWEIIIKKRDNFRKAFDGFDPILIANYDEGKTRELLADPGIVRNKLKISSTINNAKAYLSMLDKGESLDDFFWGYVDHTPIKNRWEKIEDVPGFTPLSTVISKDLKKRGFKFVGPTTVYSLMQSAGMVNDHVTSCFLWDEISSLSK